MNRSIFSGVNILVGNEWLTNQALIVEEGKIKAIIPAEMIEHHLPAKHYHHEKNAYLIPGLIDTHVHGIQGCDVMDGSKEAHIAMSQALATQGVTGYLATTMTAPAEKIETVLASVAESMHDEHLGAAILGVHLEGPFIAKNKLGAQGGEVCKPSIDLFNRWQRLSNNVIKMVTLAPELPDIQSFIAALVQQEVIASIGHTAATFEETMQAVKAGCSHATHLFNAMSGFSHRAPGASGAILLSPSVSVEMIVDGVHLHPAVVDFVWRCKGKEKIVLITDAMRATCLGDGVYDLGGQAVTVRDGQARLEDGTLAGSTLRMPRAIKHMIDYSQCSLADAITMASYNPAHLLGLSASKGSIAVGKDADLVVIDQAFKVTLSMRAGVVLHEAHE